jgi:hypothetical protein
VPLSAHRLGLPIGALTYNVASSQLWPDCDIRCGTTAALLRVHAAAGDLPECTNDDNYDGVFQAVLGAGYPRRVQGCGDCGMLGESSS